MAPLSPPLCDLTNKSPEASYAARKLDFSETNESKGFVQCAFYYKYVLLWIIPIGYTYFQNFYLNSPLFKFSLAQSGAVDIIALQSHNERFFQVSLSWVTCHSYEF